MITPYICHAINAVIENSHKNAHFCKHLFAKLRFLDFFCLFLRLSNRTKKKEVSMKKEKARPCSGSNTFVSLKEVAIWIAF